MTGIALHLRSRHAPLMVLGVAAVALLCWAAATWLASRTYFAGAHARVPVVAVGPLVAAILICPGLGGADVALERTSARPGARSRATHVVLASTLSIAALAPVGLWEADTFGSLSLTRNTLGYIGLCCLSAPVLGARAAWLPAFVYAVVIYLAAPQDPSMAAQAWAWPMQPGPLDPSWPAALCLLTFGLAIYAVRGPREDPITH